MAMIGMDMGSWSTSSRHGSDESRNSGGCKDIGAKIAGGNTGSSELRNQWELGWKGTNLQELGKDKICW